MRILSLNGSTSPHQRALRLFFNCAKHRPEKTRHLAVMLFTLGWRAPGAYLDQVYIHSCGNGHLWFRSYSESLGKAPSNQGLLPLTFGASPRLGMPSLRSCSVGPPRWAILGPARLNRHPCRFTHCAEPPLGLSRGQENQKPKQKRGGLSADLIKGPVYDPIVRASSLLQGNVFTRIQVGCQAASLCF